MATGAAALIPIFVCSSLDTKLALAVSSDDTILSLKRKFEQVHAETFPQIGEIIAKSVKIKKGEDVFHLSNCMPVKMAFHGLEGLYLLLMDVVMAPTQITRKHRPKDATTLLQYQNAEEACEIETNGQVVGVIEAHSQPGSKQTADQRETNHGLEQNINTMEGSMERGETTGIGRLVIQATEQLITGKGRLVLENDAVSDKGTIPDNQHATEKTTAADGRSKESTEKSPKNKELLDKTACDHTLSVKLGVASPEKRILKEIMATSLDNSAQDILSQHNGSCKGKESSTSFEKETTDGLTNHEDVASVVASMEHEAGTKNDLAEPVKTSSEAGRKNQREVQKSNVFSVEETTSKNTRRDSSVVGELGKISSLASNVRDPKENSLDEMDFSSQTQIKEKASVPPNEFEEPVNQGEKRKKKYDGKLVAPTGKDKNGSSLNQGSDALCMAVPVKISNKAGAEKDLISQEGTLPIGVSSINAQKEKRRKTEGFSATSPSDIPLAGERKHQREVQKSNVVSRKERASRNTRRDSLGEPGEISSFVQNGRDQEEGSLDEINLSSQTQIKEKAAVIPNEFEEPVSEGKKKKKRNEVTTLEFVEAGSNAYASDKKESHSKTPRKGKANEKEGKSNSLSEDVPKGDDITGLRSTEDENDVGQFRVEYRNIPAKNNGEKMNPIVVEEKASGSSTMVDPVRQCRLSGGGNWRCKREALHGKILCEYHESRRQNKTVPSKTLPKKRK